MKIILQPQECNGNSTFSGQIVYTKAFGETFQDETTEVILVSMSMILNRVHTIGADYLQVLTAETDKDRIKFWVICDSCVTFLLPQDY